MSRREDIALKNHENRLDALETTKLFKTKTVSLATNFTVAANTSPATRRIQGYLCRS